MQIDKIQQLITRNDKFSQIIVFRCFDDAFYPAFISENINTVYLRVRA